MKQVVAGFPSSCISGLWIGSGSPGGSPPALGWSAGGATGFVIVASRSGKVRSSSIVETGEALRSLPSPIASAETLLGKTSQRLRGIVLRNTRFLNASNHRMNGSSVDNPYVIPYASLMSTLTASEARAQLYRLIDEAAKSHVPIRITGKRHNAVLVSEEDWAAVQETLYLLSVPGMRESIKEGMESPVEECSAELDW